MLIFDQLKRGDRQIQAVAWMILVGLGILAAGLWYVQVLAAGRYRASQISQSFRTVRIPAIRGRIVDASGVALADNRATYNVNLYLDELREGFQDTFAQATRRWKLSRGQRQELGRQVRFYVASNLVDRVGHAIQQPRPLNEKLFHQHYEQRLALPLPVWADLGPEPLARYMEQVSQLPGLDLEVQPLRAYPFGSRAAHVIGHLRRDDQQADEETEFSYRLPDFSGALGVEARFNPELKGRPGVKSVLVNNLGYRQAETIWTPAEAGQTVVLTLDLAIQAVAEDALRQAKIAVPGPVRGAVVVLDARTGDVLALVSSPAFDPNQFVGRMSTAEGNALNDPRLRPMLNRATYGSYAPGSIFKIVVGLAGLEAHVLDPERAYDSPGYYLLGKGPRARRIGDTANGGQPDRFDFKKALAQSSNAYFIHYGLLAGPDAIVEMAQRFHLGELTGIPLGQEVRGLVPTREWQRRHMPTGWFDGDTANLSIGQGKILVTPLQVALMTAAVANGGTLYWPRLVARVDPPPGGEASPPQVFPAGRIRDQVRISRSNLRLLQDAMQADVDADYGTGRRAAVPGLRICAKTGTAQVEERGKVVDHTTWFTSFAPREPARWVVTVMVESGISGGESCAPVAQKIYAALQQRYAPPPAGAPRLAQNP